MTPKGHFEINWPSYDPSCAIFSSFNFMVIFNIASADIAESQLLKVTMKLKELKIAQLGSYLGRTLAVFLCSLRISSLCLMPISSSNIKVLLFQLVSFREKNYWIDYVWLALSFFKIFIFKIQIIYLFLTCFKNIYFCWNYL